MFAKCANTDSFECIMSCAAKWSSVKWYECFWRCTRRSVWQGWHHPKPLNESKETFAPPLPHHSTRFLICSRYVSNHAFRSPLALVVSSVSHHFFSLDLPQSWPLTFIQCEVRNPLCGWLVHRLFSHCLDPSTVDNPLQTVLTYFLSDMSTCSLGRDRSVNSYCLSSNKLWMSYPKLLLLCVALYVPQRFVHR